MKFKQFSTSHLNIDEAIADISSQIDQNSSFILYFASSGYNNEELSKMMAASFPSSETMGCTTSGEITTGKMLDHSIVGMCFSKESLSHSSVKVVENISLNTNGINEAFSDFEKQFSIEMNTADPEKYVGLVLIDGLSGKEEAINERIGDLTNVSFIGGSAGDDLKFKQTFVFANGKSYSNAAVLILLNPLNGFSILKTQSFVSSGKVLVPTKVDEENRKVFELNNKPALEAYADALGVTKDKVADLMFKNPLGLVFSDSEFFVRSPRVVDGDAIYFYCSVKEGMELELLHSTNIVQDTYEAINKTKETMNGFSGLINFNCILRTLDLKGQNKLDEYGNLFSDFPTVGFTTYGESYIGHINQTATMLVFK